MKKVFILLPLFISLTFCNSGHKKKELTSFVYDYEDVLDSLQEVQFNSLFKTHERKTTNEIVLVTTDSYDGKEKILFYTVDFGSFHGVGKIDKDNGVVIVFSKKNREVFIATGKGTEKVLKDEIVKRFIDSLMISKFKEELYFEGLWEGSTAVVDFLELPGHEINSSEDKFKE